MGAQQAQTTVEHCPGRLGGQAMTLFGGRQIIGMADVGPQPDDEFAQGGVGGRIVRERSGRRGGVEAAHRPGQQSALDRGPAPQVDFEVLGRVVDQLRPHRPQPRLVRLGRLPGLARGSRTGRLVRGQHGAGDVGVERGGFSRFGQPVDQQPPLADLLAGPLLLGARVRKLTACGVAQLAMSVQDDVINGLLAGVADPAVLAGADAGQSSADDGADPVAQRGFEQPAGGPGGTVVVGVENGAQAKAHGGSFRPRRHDTTSNRRK